MDNGRPGAAYEPLLTILIPSYNRGARVRALVEFLLPFVEAEAGRVALIVSNNRSTDGTERMLAHVRSPWFTLHNRETHLPTAEENIFASIGLCRGAYVWCLGDDDLPQLDTIRSALALLETGQHDMLLFNSMVIDSDGALSGGWTAPMDDEIVRCDLVDGAIALGLTFSFAGISNAILRLAPLQRTDWRPIAAQALIYSHVVWWLHAFRGRLLTIVNRPLVAYRVDNPDLIRAHFGRVARRAKVADLDFWTTGLVQLLEGLEQRNVLTPEQVAGMFEYRRDGTSFRLLDNMIHMLHSQVILSATTDEPRNRLSGTVVERMTSWLLRHDPGYFECVEVIRDIHALREDADPLPTPYAPSRFLIALEGIGESVDAAALSRVFTTLLDRRAAATNRSIGLFGQFMGYALYRHLGGCVAFDEARPVDRRAVLRSLDVRAVDATVLVAPTEPALREAIRAARAAEARQRPRELLRQEIGRNADAAAQAVGALSRIADAITVAGEFRPSLVRAAYWRLRAAVRRMAAARATRPLPPPPRRAARDVVRVEQVEPVAERAEPQAAPREVESALPGAGRPT